MRGSTISAARAALAVAVAAIGHAAGCESQLPDEPLTRHLSFDVQFQPGGISSPAAEIEKALAPCKVHGREPERGVDRWLVTVSVPESADADDLVRRLKAVPGVTAVSRE